MGKQAGGGGCRWSWDCGVVWVLGRWLVVVAFGGVYLPLEGEEPLASLESLGDIRGDLAIARHLAAGGCWREMAVKDRYEEKVRSTGWRDDGLW